MTTGLDYGDLDHFWPPLGPWKAYAGLRWAYGNQIYQFAHVTIFGPEMWVKNIYFVLFPPRSLFILCLVGALGHIRNPQRPKNALLVALRNLIFFIWPKSP